MPKGHKPDCQCAICQRVKVSKLTKEPKQEMIEEPRIVLGEKVTLVSPVRFGRRLMSPIGVSSIIEGVSEGKFKVSFRGHFAWVSPDKIK